MAIPTALAKPWPRGPVVTCAFPVWDLGYMWSRICVCSRFDFGFWCLCVGVLGFTRVCVASQE